MFHLRRKLLFNLSLLRIAAVLEMKDSDDWRIILHRLHSLLSNVPNLAAANEDIICLKSLNLQHSDEHLEELHGPIHAIFRLR